MESFGTPAVINKVTKSLSWSQTSLPHAIHWSLDFPWQCLLPGYPLQETSLHTAMDLKSLEESSILLFSTASSRFLCPQSFTFSYHPCSFFTIFLQRLSFFLWLQTPHLSGRITSFTERLPHTSDSGDHKLNPICTSKIIINVTSVWC